MLRIFGDFLQANGSGTIRDDMLEERWSDWGYTKSKIIDMWRKCKTLCRDPSILQGMEDRMFESIELWEEYREEEQKWMEKVSGWQNSVYIDKRNEALRKAEWREAEWRKAELRKIKLRKRELRERELREGKLREREPQEREPQKIEPRERELQERELRERELLRIERLEIEQRERELRERELRERELRERELREGELGERSC